MEKTITGQKLPHTDSIEELARFWDAHDLTDFEDDLEEVVKPIFARRKGASMSVELRPSEAQRISEIARSKGVREATLLRQWIVERLRTAKLSDRGPGKTRARR